MTVAAFPARAEVRHGVTYAQAMEMFERFFMADRARIRLSEGCSAIFWGEACLTD